MRKPDRWSVDLQELHLLIWVLIFALGMATCSGWRW